MTVASRREREQQRRRESILDSARMLFKEKGFDSTTVDEIAAWAELGKGTIYSYFKSKDQIYIAILEEELEVLRERMEKSIGNSTSAADALNRLYETFIQYNRERRGFIRAVFVQVEEQSSVRMGDLLRGLKEKSTEWTELVLKVLRRGVESGEFRTCETERISRIIIGMILGMIIQSEIGQIDEDLSTYRDTLLGLILEGISK